MRKIILLLIYLLPTLTLCVASQAIALDSYYVISGDSFQRVQGDPKAIMVEYWAAYFFKKGEPTSPVSRAWGAHTSDSPEAVARHVQMNQDFEKRYQRWCGCAWGADTFFNAVAPVAVVKKTSKNSAIDSQKAGLLKQLHETWDQLIEVRDRFNNAADLAGEQKLLTLKSGPFSDFMHAMHESVDKAMSLQNELTLYSDIAVSRLEDQLGLFQKSVHLAETKSAQAFQTLAGDVDSSANKHESVARRPITPDSASGDISWLEDTLEYHRKRDLGTALHDSHETEKSSVKVDVGVLTQTRTSLAEITITMKSDPTQRTADQMTTATTFRVLLSDLDPESMIVKESAKDGKTVWQLQVFTRDSKKLVEVITDQRSQLSSAEHSEMRYHKIQFDFSDGRRAIEAKTQLASLIRSRH